FNDTATTEIYTLSLHDALPVYDSFDGSGTGGNWFQVGGTSLSTPMWAGLIAIVDQGRVANGLKTYDGATGTLPRLYALPQSDFNDITSGGNAQYKAGPGYDLVTGRGTPIASKLVPDLANISGQQAPQPPPVQTAPVIASLTSSVNPAQVSQVFTLTANGVTDSSASISSVSFYWETNGKSGLQTGSGGDTLLATLTNGSNGWKLNLSASAPGTYILYAQATASNGLLSNVVSLTETVVGASRGGFASRPAAEFGGSVPSSFAANLFGAEGDGVFGQKKSTPWR